MSRDVARNASYMTLASVGQKILAFLYFALIARVLGPEQQGVYTTALTFTTIMVVFVDLGFTNVIIREVAKAKEKAQTIFSTVVVVKLFLSIATYAATVLLVNVLGYDEQLRHLIYVSAITMLFDSFHLSMYGVIRGMGDLRYESFMIFGSQFVTLVLGSIFLYSHLPLIFLIVAFTLASMVNVCFAAYILYTRYHIRLLPKFDRGLFQQLWRIALPFALAGIFSRVYSYIDTLLLERFMNTTAVGWYSVPYKITYAFQFIPLALVAALYPQFSAYYKENKQKLAYIFERGMVYLSLAAFPIAIGIAVLAQDIIVHIFTDAYAPSIVPLRILIISLIFSFISFPIGAFLNACDRQVTQTAIVAVIMLVNVLLNILLIPLYGPTGAAISALCGNILLAVLGYSIIPRITAISHRYIFTQLGLILLASVIMGVAVYAINHIVPYVVAIVIGGGVYSACVYLFRIVRPSQLREVLLIMKKPSSL